MPSELTEIRRAVVAAVESLGDWQESSFAPDFFGSDPEHFMHRSFSVAIPSSAPIDVVQDPRDGMLVQTAIEVAWAHRIQGDGQTASYEDALDAETQLVRAVVNVLPGHIMVSRLARSARREGWLIGSASFTIPHRYGIA